MNRVIRGCTALPHSWRAAAALILTFVFLAGPLPARHATAQTASTATYTNPLQIQIPSGGRVQSCADPSIIRGQTTGDTSWYIYCTTDPLNDQDKTGSSFNFHLMPIFKSSDLVNWIYQGDVFPSRPGWTAGDAGLWAPDIRFFNGKYYLYYTVNKTRVGGSAIGVATSSSPTGPWTDSGGPVIEPQGDRWVFDPDVVEDNGQRYIFYGSFNGGISARTLSADGLHSDKASEKQIVIPNRYEGTYIVKHGDYWYFFGSATDCCNGPLTGYSVFAGRSANLLGPYVDRDGVSLLDSRVGGTPVISMNGNRWVGPGHNAIFADLAGQDWFLYHAVDRNDPYFAGTSDFTKRPVLMDPLDWVDGWPTVRGGLWASDSAQPAPVAQSGEKSQYQPTLAPSDTLGSRIGKSSDEFKGRKLASRWRWLRRPAKNTYAVTGGTFRFNTQNADLFKDSNSASVLNEPAPQGSYAVETRVKVNVPAQGCCQNYAQAGLVIYKDDDDFIKLTDVSIWETRQTEFAKEINSTPRYGNTVVGPPGDWAWLRIVKTTQASQELYRAYTSRDGRTWVRGGVWTHQLGAKARIGLVSMGASGFTANFDYVHVYRLNP